MLLFLLASGLAVTLGLMNFVNLAHGAFAMAGGYLSAVLSNKMGVPFLATLPLAFIFAAALGALLEPTLYRRLYAGRISTRCCSRSASCSWRSRPSTTSSASHAAIRQAAAVPPRSLRGRGRGHRRSIACSSSSCARRSRSACTLILSRTRFGSRLRAAVDDRRVASGLGIDVNEVFLATFAVRLGPGGPGRRARRGDPRPRSDVSAEVHDLLPRRRRGRRHDDDHRSAGSLRCCSASPTSPASTTCPSSAPSSSTA